MASKNYYSSLIKQICSRSVESTVSMLGITNKNLRQHLIANLSNQQQHTSFLADPVFESMFPWEKHQQTMEQLSGNLLCPSLVNAMDQSNEHRFAKYWFPFKHQIKAWKTLLDTNQNKSIVVTSGTGSGKTECFMVPILNDLATEYERQTKPLIGIRALFIYPLNALINSQRERLRAWTSSFDGGVRFCLYNGNTEENKHNDQKKYTNELLTRKNIRETPPPIMVTNITMLEYMLIRQVDAPIIEKSQGKLRWIVLDEAHTYVGSQATELSLLLRRVLHTFGVEAKNVRFVATSATIGDKNAEQKLQEYLANLAGIEKEQICIVGGKREVTQLISTDRNTDDYSTLSDIDNGVPASKKRYARLSNNNQAVKLREVLTKNSAVTLSKLAEDVYGASSDNNKQALLQMLDIASFTSNPESNEAFLPVRAHLFHQVISGLWCCVDKNCKIDSQLNNNWPFGYVYTQRRLKCDCGAPIYELVFCSDCNEPHLMAEQTLNGKIIQYDREFIDEFSLDCEDFEENSEKDDSSLGKIFIAPQHVDEITYTASINPEDLSIQGQGDEKIELHIIYGSDKVSCSCCNYSHQPHPFRQCLLGTPFYISNNVPTLLEACQESKQANELPSRGRRLITFTDSRQGTARISTKIQQDSERNAIRGQVYRLSVLNKNDYQVSAEDQENIKKYKSIIEKFKGIDNEIVGTFKKLLKELEDKISNAQARKPLSWDDLVGNLQSSPDVYKWMYDYYSELDPVLFNDSGSRILAEMILLREFARRPKKQNSLETLGLVAICYPKLNNIKEIPAEWEKLNFNLQDWQDFLKIALDFYVRENTILNIPPEWSKWMGAKIYPKTVLHPKSKENKTNSVVKWPQVVKGRNNRLIRLIIAATKIDITNKYNIDLVNAILQNAWKVLTKKLEILKSQPASPVQYQLTRKQLAFTVIDSAWICPVTNRLLDTTFCGLTPYLPFNTESADIKCKKVTIPVCELDTSDFISEHERKDAIREWIANSKEVNELRLENLWSDISDRIIEGSSFYRTAEHSAQQPAKRLQKYEDLFKQGKLNILSCSTTMEMGVDIGGISVVAMNNVPPHPANYLQRAGRAGRRGETQALAFTICKDNPHERSVFKNPLWAFTTSIPAPYIVLNSEKIVQRHVNSLLTAVFLKKIVASEDTSVINLNCEWFFINSNKIDASPYKKMCNWLASILRKGLPNNLATGISNIIKDSVLSSKTKASLCKTALEELETIGKNWLSKYQQLQQQINKLTKVATNDPFKKKIEYDLKCYGQDYLLAELSSRTFLPSYGFPTGVATFDNYSISDFKNNKYRKATTNRIDNLTRMKERPGRDLAVAIREYAPGADIVLDGLVYKSAGILLNPFAPDENFKQAVKMKCEWRCHKCGYIDQADEALFNNKCTECNTSLKPENIKKFIEPQGFTVDFYSSPTNNISVQNYIPVEEPWVTANGDLKELFNPSLGSYRNNTAGHIFHYSSGANGKGYAICLRCGKADSMIADNEFPENLQPSKAHKKLQGKPQGKESADCEGSDDQYSIVQNLHLGTSDQTDVFEIYLKDPQTNKYLPHKPNDNLSWTIAVVLRQALANIHGINADEIGYTVKPTTLELSDCEYAVAGIVLFDRCGGGAGFSSAAPKYIKDMLNKAKNYLDCPDECNSACQSCLLGYDTRFHVNVLNRLAAEEYLNSIASLLV